MKTSVGADYLTKKSAAEDSPTNDRTALLSSLLGFPTYGLAIPAMGQVAPANILRSVGFKRPTRLLQQISAKALGYVCKATEQVAWDAAQHDNHPMPYMLMLMLFYSKRPDRVTHAALSQKSPILSSNLRVRNS